MVSKAQKIRLGIFLTISILIFLAMIVVLSINRFFKEKDIYHIAYQNVSVTGLDVGSSVKFLGLTIGSVQNIKIDPKDISRIIVTIGVKKGTPIKKDVHADIFTVGITGLKMIELRGGTNESPNLQPGDFIQAGTSLTENITGKAEVIAGKIEQVLNNLLRLTTEQNQNKIFSLVDDTRKTLQNANTVLTENRGTINRSFRNLDSTFAHLSSSSKSADLALRKIDFFVQSDSFRTTLSNIAQIADKLNKSNIYNLDKQLNLAVGQLNHLLNQLDIIITANRFKFNKSVDELNQAIESLNRTARRVEANPAILLGGSKPENPPDQQLEQ